MDKYQAKPEKTFFISDADFGNNNETAVYWLGGAGVLVNARGTTVLIDPTISAIPDSPFADHGMLSEVNAKRFLIDLPIDAAHIQRLDAVLFTHSDDDHMGVVTAPMLLKTGAAYHGTPESAAKLRSLGVPADRITEHPELDRFSIGNIEVAMTHAYHPWQRLRPDLYDHPFEMQDCCGYKLYTPDGVVWHPGDSLLLDEHLQNTDVDLLFIDFSDDTYHFGLENALRLANTLQQADMIMYHWGTLYSPDQACYNASPKTVEGRIKAPERLHILAAGEKYTLKKKAHS